MSSLNGQSKVRLDSNSNSSPNFCKYETIVPFVQTKVVKKFKLKNKRIT